MGQAVYPSNLAVRFSPFIVWIRLETSTGASEAIAAAVLEVGRLEESPRAKTLGNLVLWRVYLSTSTKPSLLASGDFLITSGGDMYGTTCRTSYGLVVTWLVSRCLKVAMRLSLSTLTRSVRYDTSMFFSAAMMSRASPYFLTWNIEGRLVWKRTLVLSRMPRVRKWVSFSHMTFCGPPPHLIGHAGCVNSASPPVNSSMILLAFSAVL
mmetsp:Transcript_37572/g.88434  ORF Transcript_37572/g.88434 Transcript_37572/m.88434 type:complete len:209 (-) Transcript_37572:562-1188(-)